MKSTNFILAGALFVLGLVSVPSIVYSQSSEGRLDIEEIIVTGTKRDISQQDVPVAVSTLTSKQLDNTFRNDVFALGQLAPNVTLTPQNGFNAIAGGMRGTGFISILVTKDPSVGVVVDDFAFNHVQAQAIEMFDMEQVEIYRGPQGTLFGKNTTGGALSFTTKKPILGETFFDFETTYGQYSSNDASIEKISAAANFPIGDKMAVRISVIQDQEEGYYTNNKPSGSIISLGGGTPCYHDNMGIILNCSKNVFFINTTVEVLSRRLFKEKTKRPIIKSISSVNKLKEFISKHLFERIVFYNQANFIITDSNQGLDNICKEIIEKLNL